MYNKRKTISTVLGSDRCLRLPGWLEIPVKCFCFTQNEKRECIVFLWAFVVTNLLKELGWPSLEHRRKYHRLDLFYKTKTGKTALQMPDQLNRPMSRPTWAINSTCSIQPITKGHNYAQSYFPRTIRDWNNLPRHIRHCSTESTFKSALFKHFFEWIVTCFSF